MNLEQIKIIYDRLYNEPFPSDRGKEVSGIDLVMIDADVMGLSQNFILAEGHLMTDQVKTLANCFMDLKVILHHLEKTERQYFASLKQLAQEILDVTNTEKLSENEIELRHKWKTVYDEIKIIVNELDPLGVADIVDDEYNDLNFRIYSQLLDNREDTKMFETIKTFVEKDYEVQLDRDDINEAVQKIKKIEITK